MYLFNVTLKQKKQKNGNVKDIEHSKQKFHWWGGGGGWMMDGRMDGTDDLLYMWLSKIVDFVKNVRTDS